MLLRHLIQLNEKSLTAAELSKNDGKYLKTLITLIGNETPLPIDPAYRAKFEDDVAIVDLSELPALQAALDSGNISSALPKKVKMSIAGKPHEQSLGILFKGKEFTGLEGKKAYNAGHLAELFMGISVSAKFFNIGQEITTEQLYDMMEYIETSIEGKNYVFQIERAISYPESGAKFDTLSFLARVPARSAEAFLEQSRNRKFVGDLNAIFSSAVRYVNESSSISESCKKVREDKNNNKIDVISDGTTDAKGTKADLTLKVDGTKINLLSLKTYGSDTLGQFSGLTTSNLTKWFRTNFDFDISPYISQFDPSLGEETLYKNLLKLYDDVVYPYVEEQVNDQSPGAEAKIVKHLAHAANVYARGESLEDVEIVKLDDKISTGSYKILKFSHSLKEAMTHLDLETKYVNQGQSRTIQIWVKPAEGEKIAKGTNKLCQFRTTKTGGYTRNYFESGPMLEALTSVTKNYDGKVAPKDKPALTKTSSTRELK
jgi:hypothetical protein